MTILEGLQGVFNETLFGVYYAGTLEVKGMAAHSEGWEMIEGMFTPGRELNPYTPNEKLWWCKCYVKYKTPSHSYYEEAKTYIDNYEKEFSCSGSM